MTLVRTAGAGRAAMERAFAELWGIEQATAGIAFDGRTDFAIFRETVQRHGLAEGDEVAAVRRAQEAYLAHLPETLKTTAGVVLPGVTQLLDALRAAGVPLGLATGNARRCAALKLGHFGLWNRFVGGGFGDNTPDRAALVAAGIAELAAMAGIAPGEAKAIVVGDTPLDVQAAQMVGARALGVATGRYSAEELRAAGADYVVDDLSATEAVLALLLDSPL